MEDLQMNVYSPGQMDEMIRTLSDVAFVDLLMHIEYSCFQYNMIDTKRTVILN